jgi:hypothetical protein
MFSPYGRDHFASSSWDRERSPWEGSGDGHHIVGSLFQLRVVFIVYASDGERSQSEGWGDGKRSLPQCRGDWEHSP